MADTGRRVRGRLAPEAMYPAGVPFVQVRRVTLSSGITLRLAESGAVSSPPIVLLHGWGASLYMWRAWFAPLAEAGYRAIAVDLPGHGLSDKPALDGAYTLERQVAIVRELFDVESLHGARVVAQSMGGTIALELALGNPAQVGTLALVNASAFGRVQLQPLARLLTRPRFDAVLGRHLPRWSIGNAQRLAYADPRRVTAADVDQYWAPTQFPEYWGAMRRLLHEFTWRRAPVERLASRLSALASGPLLVLSGRDRLVRQAAPYVDALRRAGVSLEVHELARGGHAVNEEEPQLVLPRVLAHLR